MIVSVVSTFLIFMFVDQLLPVDVFSQPYFPGLMARKTTLDFRCNSLKSWNIDNNDLTQLYSLSIFTDFRYFLSIDYSGIVTNFGSVTITSRFSGNEPALLCRTSILPILPDATGLRQGRALPEHNNQSINFEYDGPDNSSLFSVWDFNFL